MRSLLRTSELIALALLLLVIGVLAAAPTVATGTLVGSGNIEIVSNVPELQGKNLYALWRSTPVASDQLIVKSEMLPDKCGASNSAECTIPAPIVVDFPAPTWEQVFRVTAQQPLITGDYVFKKYTFSAGDAWAIFTGSKSQDAVCYDVFKKDLASTYSGRKLLLGAQAHGLTFRTGCNMEFLLESERLGWYGNAAHLEWKYRQEIVFKGKGSVVLEKNEKTDRLTGILPGVALARLTSYSRWVNAELPDNNLGGFHPGPEDIDAFTPWTPWEKTTQLITYEQKLDSIRRKMNSDTGLLSLGDLAVLKADLASLRDAASLVRQQATNLFPASWDGMTEGAVRSIGNGFAVAPRRTTMISDVQLIMSGTAFGLRVRAGEPEIKSVGSVSFAETANGRIPYTVRNKATGADDHGSFRLSAVCDKSFYPMSEDIELAPGAEKSGELIASYRGSLSADREQASCELVFREQTTGVEAMKSFIITLIRKSECTEGGQKYLGVVDGYHQIQTHDRFCVPKGTVTCLASENDVKVLNGLMQCVKKTDGGCAAGYHKNSIGVCVKDECNEGYHLSSDGVCVKDDTFSAWLLGLALVLGLVAFVTVLVYVPLPPKFRAILALIALVVVLLGVPLLVKAVTAGFKLLFSW